MDILGTPDMYYHSRLTRNLDRVSTAFNRTAEEVTTGLYADKVKAAGGDTTRLYTIERELKMTEGRLQSINIAADRAAATQTTLDRLQGISGALGAELAGAVAIGDAGSAKIYAGRARGAFDEAVSALNTRYGDRSLFSGAATDRAALAPAEDILGEIMTRVSAATDAASAIAAVDQYFADPAGFAASGYLGSASDAAPAEVEQGVRVNYAVRADSEDIVNVLKTLALGVAGAEGGFAQAESMAILGEAGERGLTAGDRIARLRGEIGISEERIELARTREDASHTFLMKARAGIIARDPYEAAAEYNALENQLETMLMVTSRLSQLHLTNYL